MTLTGALALYHQLDQRLHNLRMTWPIGIRSLDDARDAEIARLTTKVADLKVTIANLRNGG